MKILSISMALIALEVLFWLILGKWFYNRRKQKKSIWDEEP